MPPPLQIRVNNKTTSTTTSSSLSTTKHRRRFAVKKLIRHANGKKWDVIALIQRHQQLFGTSRVLNQRRRYRNT